MPVNTSPSALSRLAMLAHPSESAATKPLSALKHTAHELKLVRSQLRKRLEAIEAGMITLARSVEELPGKPGSQSSAAFVSAATRVHFAAKVHSAVSSASDTCIEVPSSRRDQYKAASARCRAVENQVISRYDALERRIRPPRLVAEVQRGFEAEFKSDLTAVYRPLNSCLRIAEDLNSEVRQTAKRFEQYQEASNKIVDLVGALTTCARNFQRFCGQYSTLRAIASNDEWLDHLAQECRPVAQEATVRLPEIVSAAHTWISLVAPQVDRYIPPQHAAVAYGLAATLANQAIPAAGIVQSFTGSDSGKVLRYAALAESRDLDPQSAAELGTQGQRLLLTELGGREGEIKKILQRLVADGYLSEQAKALTLKYLTVDSAELARAGGAAAAHNPSNEAISATGATLRQLGLRYLSPEESAGFSPAALRFIVEKLSTAKVDLRHFRLLFADRPDLAVLPRKELALLLEDLCRTFSKSATAQIDPAAFDSLSKVKAQIARIVPAADIQPDLFPSVRQKVAALIQASGISGLNHELASAILVHGFFFAGDFRELSEDSIAYNSRRGVDDSRYSVLRSLIEPQLRILKREGAVLHSHNTGYSLNLNFAGISNKSLADAVRAVIALHRPEKARLIDSPRQ